MECSQALSYEEFDIVSGKSNCIEVWKIEMKTRTRMKTSKEYSEEIVVWKNRIVNVEWERADRQTDRRRQRNTKREMETDV